MRLFRSAASTAGSPRRPGLLVLVATLAIGVAGPMLAPMVIARLQADEGMWTFDPVSIGAPPESRNLYAVTPAPT